MATSVRLALIQVQLLLVQPLVFVIREGQADLEPLQAVLSFQQTEDQVPVNAWLYVWVGLGWWGAHVDVQVYYGWSAVSRACVCVCVTLCVCVFV